MRFSRCDDYAELTELTLERRDDLHRSPTGRGTAGKCERIVWVSDCDGVRSCGTGWIP